MFMHENNTKFLWTILFSEEMQNFLDICRLFWNIKEYNSMLERNGLD